MLQAIELNIYNCENE